MDIIAYGYHPVVLPIDELTRIHGNDERLSLDNIRVYGAKGYVTEFEIERQAVNGAAAVKTLTGDGS